MRLVEEDTVHSGGLAGEFSKALVVAGITDYVRPFHDARHGSLRNGAAGGEAPIVLMARAGHRSMATTNQYLHLHLAGVVFRDEAQLEERMLGGGREFYPTEPISRHLTAPETAQETGS
jgi:integrase